MKQKTGVCRDCDNGLEVPIIAGRCRNHYWQHRAQVKERERKERGESEAKTKRLPIKQVSDKRKKLDKAYKVLRQVFLSQRRHCEANLTGCTITATEIHHKAGRGQQYLNTALWLPICRSCHTWVTEHSKEAIERGLSVSRIN